MAIEQEVCKDDREVSVLHRLVQELRDAVRVSGVLCRGGCPKAQIEEPFEARTAIDLASQVLDDLLS